MGERIQKLSGKSLDQFRFLPGHKTSIRNILATLTLYDAEKFMKATTKKKSDGAVTFLDHHEGHSRSTTRRSNYKKIEQLDLSIDYEQGLKDRLISVIKIADPYLNPELELTKDIESDQRISFNANCVFCPPHLKKTYNIAAYVSKNYLRWGIGNYVRHLKSNSHPNQAKNIVEFEVSHHNLITGE